MVNVREEALIAQKRTFLYYLAATALIFLEDQEKMKKEQAKEEIKPTRKRKERTVRVREWLTRRHHFGHYDQLLTELHKKDPSGYRNYLRITPDLFQEKVESLTPHFEKKTTFMREPLDVGLKPATTLRFLATGNSYPSLQYSFRVEISTIIKFLQEVCKVIIEV